MEKILGIIVTYNPDLSDLERNLSSIVKQVDKLFLFDNNSSNKDQIKALIENTNVEAVFSPENVGLGRAYNAALENNYKNYKYFVTFDQDTYIPQTAISKLIRVLDDNPDIGAIGPEFSREEMEGNKDGRILYVEALIQSCTVFRSSLYEKIGGFNENYFIDSIDFEYCLRILANGLKVAKYTGIVIKHDLGEMKKSLGISYFSHNHIRNYYIARNHVDLSKKYFKKFPSFILKKNAFFLLHFFKIVILERDPNKINYFVKGLRNKKL